MNIHRATSAKTAIQIHVKENELGNADYVIDKHIQEIFGGIDGNFFVHNSRIMESFDKSKTYKVFLIEDRDQVKHTVFFELVKEKNEKRTGPKTFSSNSRYL